MTAQAQELISHDVPQPSEGGALVSMIERLAIDPRVDVEKLERLLMMQERVMDRNSKSAFMAAFSAMQPELPTIERNGRIVVYSKADRDRVGGPPPGAVPQQQTPYALFEDINEAVRPILARHAFGLSFRIGSTADGKITVTCILSHGAGHSEQTEMVLKHDASGSKNDVQAIGSSVSYGKRYTLLAILNISSRAKIDADDDGNAAGTPTEKADDPNPMIDDDQATHIDSLITSTGANRDNILKAYRVADISGLRVSQYQDALAKLRAKQSATK